jgi:hypothetical protein
MKTPLLSSTTELNTPSKFNSKPDPSDFMDNSALFFGVFVGALLVLVVVIIVTKIAGSKKSQSGITTESILWSKLITNCDIVTVDWLSFRDVLQWFNAKKDLKKSDKDNVAFTLGGRVEEGVFKAGIFNKNTQKYNLIQGFYNERTSEIVDFRFIEANSVDQELLTKHQDSNEVVVYL